MQAKLTLSVYDLKSYACIIEGKMTNVATAAI